MEPTEETAKRQLEKGANRGRTGHSRAQGAKGKWGGKRQELDVERDCRQGRRAGAAFGIGCPPRGLLSGALRVGQTVVSFSLSKNKY